MTTTTLPPVDYLIGLVLDQAEQQPLVAAGGLPMLFPGGGQTLAFEPAVVLALREILTMLRPIDIAAREITAETVAMPRKSWEAWVQATADVYEAFMSGASAEQMHFLVEALGSAWRVAQSELQELGSSETQSN